MNNCAQFLVNCKQQHKKLKNSFRMFLKAYLKKKLEGFLRSDAFETNEFTACR